jgi:hypothetical protein
MARHHQRTARKEAGQDAGMELRYCCSHHGHGSGECRSKALEIADGAKLGGLREQFDAVGVPNHGIEQDSATGASYISFYDPDGLAWELYAMPTR